MLLTFQMYFSQHLLDQGWQTYGKWRDFLGTQHLLLSQFVLFLCPISIYEYIVRNMSIFTHLIAQRLYMNCCCYQIVLPGDIFTQNGWSAKR